MNKQKLFSALLLLVTLIFQAATPGLVYATGTIVGDGTPGSCDEAALEAALAVGGSITFNCGGPATFLFTSTKAISTNTQIDGAGIITFSGGNSVRLFVLNSPSVLDLTGLTISNGYVISVDLNPDNLENGGAMLIEDGAAANIYYSTLSGNHTVNGYGGAIYVKGGDLNIVNSTFSNNNADVELLGPGALGGGAIQNNDGTVNISGSTFFGNSVTSHTADGGAIYNGDFDNGFSDPDTGIPDSFPDVLNITNSTFYDNHLLNTSVIPSSGNSAGAVRSASVLTITHSTISDNDGGISGLNAAAGAVTITHGTATLTNNIFANSNGSDCAIRLEIDGLTSAGNLIENDNVEFGGCGTLLSSDDPNLGPLQDNGGPTLTMALNAGSPAIDALGTCVIATDQRGVLRPQASSGMCDLGAYELDNIPPSITNITSANTNGFYGMGQEINITVTFDEVVKVVGAPQLNLETGTTNRHAGYAGGSGTNTLAFVYTVQTGDMSSDLDYKSSLALDVNGGSIRDLALNNATLTLPNPGAVGSLSANKDIVINTTVPLILSFVRQIPQTSTTNVDTLVFRASFSGTVNGVDINDFSVVGGTTATATNVSAVNSSTYDITISGGNLAGFNGVVNLNLGNNQNITDPDGIPLPMGEPAIDETYTLENTAPSVLSSLRADPEVTTAAVVHYIVTFSEPVVNVGLNDFVLTKAGASGAVITNISGSGATYTVDVNTGNFYGTIRLDVPVTATIEDMLGNSVGGLPYVSGQSYTINKPPTFVDVLPSHPYWKDIEILYANGLTGGCSTNPLKFCPDQIMDRAQASVFMVRGAYGAGYLPNPSANLFQDNWTPGLWARPWAEAMRETTLTTGCSLTPLLYCPWTKLPREQVVIFGLKMKYGNGYLPPVATGNVFADMTDPTYYATSWAEKAFADGLIQACGVSGGKPKFCPNTLVTRGLGAYVIVRAKNLTMP